MNILFDILLIPTLALIVLGFALAPLGCFFAWRRLAFFGDGLSHACVFGIAIALVLKIHFLLGIFLTAIAVVFFFFIMESSKNFAADTLFSLLSYTFFAAGIVALSCFKGTHVNIDDILFGEFLSIRSKEFLSILATVALSLFVIYRYYPILILQSLNDDMAFVYHKYSKRIQFLFMMTAGLMVALGMYLLGALLLPALMILPAACARVMSSSPKQMIVFSILFSVLGCLLGIGISYALDAPTSAMMVLANSSLFVFLLLFKKSLSYV